MNSLQSVLYFLSFFAGQTASGLVDKICTLDVSAVTVLFTGALNGLNEQRPHIARSLKSCYALNMMIFENHFIVADFIQL